MTQHQDHRFDNEWKSQADNLRLTPNPILWNRIDQELRPVESPIRRWLRWAAILIGLMCVTGIGYRILLPHMNQPYHVENLESLNNSSFQQALHQWIHHHDEKINQ